MPIRNSDLVDPERGLFSILGLVAVRLDESHWWQSEDIDREGAQGAIFRAYKPEVAEQGELEVASITVVDVTDDPTEPDIDTLKQADIPALDSFLRHAISEQFLGDGRQMTRWMSSQLNESNELKGLVTAYIAMEEGKERQFIALRIKVKNRKLVAVGIFDVAEKDVLAAPIFNAIRNMVVLG